MKRIFLSTTLLLATTLIQARTINEKILFDLLRNKGINHANVVLRQALLESNHFRSNLCRKHHNLFGLKKGNHYAHFASINDCISYYKLKIQMRVPLRQNETYYDYLRRIGYATDRNYIKKLKRIKLNSIDSIAALDELTLINLKILLTHNLINI